MPTGIPTITESSVLGFSSGPARSSKHEQVEDDAAGDEQAWHPGRHVAVVAALGEHRKLGIGERAG